MILKVFAIRDMKAQAFMQPFFSPAIGTAIRAFNDACNDDKSPFVKHPSDYVLYEIGAYDDSTAAVTAISPVKMLSCASDFVVQYIPTGVDALRASGNKELCDAVDKVHGGK